MTEIIDAAMGFGSEEIARRPGHHRATRDLHGDPPLTPAGVLLRHRAVVPIIAGLFVLLALAAAIDGGSLLLMWDRPAARGMDAIRTPVLDEIMKTVTRLGGTATAAAGFWILVLVGLAWRRCRSVAILVIISTLGRPPLEWTLKALVDRPRPRLAGTPFEGPSFPSGHVLAAVALWGLVPPVMALLTHRRRVWWASVAAAGVVIGLIAASRVYLSAHWLSDVVGGLLVGALYLVAMELVLERLHGRVPHVSPPPGRAQAECAATPAGDAGSRSRRSVNTYSSSGMYRRDGS